MQAEQRRAVRLALALGAWFAALYALRFGAIEIEPAADPCLADPASAACAVRAGFGLWIHLNGSGTLALLLALSAHLARGTVRRALGTAALFVAAAALALYNARYGAPAAVLALLALAWPSPATGGR